jgi:hypothetical protein
MIELKDLLSPGAILISAAVAAAAIFVNFAINRRNRRVRAAIDLYASYYGQEFTESRYALFQYLLDRETEPNLKWDFEEWFTAVRAQKDEPAMKMQVALNRVAAFYLAMQQLLHTREIDEQITEQLFRFAYAYWDHWRKRFYADSPATAKYIFEPIAVFGAVCAPGQPVPPTGRT